MVVVELVMCLAGGKWEVVVDHDDRSTLDTVAHDTGTLRPDGRVVDAGFAARLPAFLSRLSPFYVG